MPTPEKQAAAPALVLYGTQPLERCVDCSHTHPWSGVGGAEGICGVRIAPEPLDAAPRVPHTHMCSCQRRHWMQGALVPRGDVATDYPVPWVEDVRLPFTSASGRASDAGPPIKAAIWTNGHGLIIGEPDGLRTDIEPHAISRDGTIQQAVDNAASLFSFSPGGVAATTVTVTRDALMRAIDAIPQRNPCPVCRGARRYHCPRCKGTGRMKHDCESLSCSHTCTSPCQNPGCALRTVANGGPGPDGEPVYELACTQPGCVDGEHGAHPLEDKIGALDRSSARHAWFGSADGPCFDLNLLRPLVERMRSRLTVTRATDPAPMAPVFLMSEGEPIWGSASTGPNAVPRMAIVMPLHPKTVTRPAASVASKWVLLPALRGATGHDQGKAVRPEVRSRRTRAAK